MISSQGMVGAPAKEIDVLIRLNQYYILDIVYYELFKIYILRYEMWRVCEFNLREIRFDPIVVVHRHILSPMYDLAISLLKESH